MPNLEWKLYIQLKRNTKEKTCRWKNFVHFGFRWIYGKCWRRVYGNTLIWCLTQKLVFEFRMVPTFCPSSLSGFWTANAQLAQCIVARQSFLIKSSHKNESILYGIMIPINKELHFARIISYRSRTHITTDNCFYMIIPST